MTTIPAGRINSLGMPGPPGPAGEDGMFPLTLPDAETETDRVPYTVVSGGEIDFDYLASDDVVFGDAGVPVGRYMAAAGNNIRNAIVAALAANPTKRLFKLPPGEWNFSAALTEASGGLRSNLIFDGEDPERCILYDPSGHMFLGQVAAGTNIAFKNITFSLTAPTPFNSTINLESWTNILIDNCKFLTDLSGAAGTDGIRHGVFLLGGSDQVVRNCVFDGAQLQCCGLARSVVRVKIYNNRWLNCNDLGISCNSGDGPGSGLTLRHIHIHDNEFFNIAGTGPIYVGDDAVTNPPDEMSDVVIENNVISGALGNSLTPGQRNGIQVAWALVNKRIKVVNNIISNSNQSVTGLSNVRGIYAFLRAASMTSAVDVDICSNLIDFISTGGMFEALAVTGSGLQGFRVNGNTINGSDAGPNSRAMVLQDISQSEVGSNTVRGSSGNALTISPARGDISDLRIHHNYLKTATAFKSTILFEGANDVSRLWVDHNTLRSAQNSVINTGSGSWAWHYVHNSQSHALGAGATPTTDTGNVTE